MTKTSSKPFLKLAAILTMILSTKIYRIYSQYETNTDITVAQTEEVAKQLMDQATAPKINVRGKILTDHNIYETELINDLNSYRQSLIERERTLVVKAAAITAIEAKLKHKLRQLQLLETSVIKDEQISHRGNKLKSLVNIYERMSSKKAAEVFDNLPTDTVIVILERMSASKAAPILAHMDTTKVSEISKAYATFER